MEEQREKPPFDPNSRPSLKKLLWKLAPEFYTQEELTEIEKVDQSYNSELDSIFTSQVMKASPRKEEIANKKKRQHSSDEGSTSERRVKPKKKKKKKEPNQHGNAIVPPPPPPPPELPIHVRNMIADLNGSDIRYVMCKKLFPTDFSEGHNRLSMPRAEIFLTKIEEELLDTRDEDNKPNGLEVVVLDPNFKEYTMFLKKWNNVYSLTKHWNDLWKENNWTKDNKLYDELHIWSFRVDGMLHFTLNNKIPNV